MKDGDGSFAPADQRAGSHLCGDSNCSTLKDQTVWWTTQIPSWLWRNRPSLHPRRAAGPVLWVSFQPTCVWWILWEGLRPSGFQKLWDEPPCVYTCLKVERILSRGWPCAVWGPHDCISLQMMWFWLQTLILQWIFSSSLQAGSEMLPLWNLKDRSSFFQVCLKSTVRSHMNTETLFHLFMFILIKLTLISILWCFHQQILLSSWRNHRPQLHVLIDQILTDESASDKRRLPQHLSQGQTVN